MNFYSSGVYHFYNIDASQFTWLCELYCTFTVRKSKKYIKFNVKIYIFQYKMAQEVENNFLGSSDHRILHVSSLREGAQHFIILCMHTLQVLCIRTLNIRKQLFQHILELQ